VEEIESISSWSSWGEAVALNIKDARTDHLARELAKLTGQSITEAVAGALEEKLEAERRRRGKKINRDALRKIVERIAAQPFADTRSADEILGYDEYGLPR
jgi:antitoxin VapB